MGSRWAAVRAWSLTSAIRGITAEPAIGVTVAAYEAWNIEYATLTDKAAKDFAVIPAWPSPGRARRRQDLDLQAAARHEVVGRQAATAEDVAWTVNMSRDEEWINHAATTTNLDAVAKDDITLVITSKVPEPSCR